MNKRKYIIIFTFCLLFFNLFCDTQDKLNNDEIDKFFNGISNEIPEHILRNIKNNKKAFFADLENVLNSEREDSLILVDKQHFLSENFKPAKIIVLKNSKKYAYQVNNKGLKLSALACEPLQNMALAAKKDGVTLLVSSSYRTYAYQKGLFARYSNKYGVKQAERFSARAGTSQHQLGTTIDFGSISDAYANTRAGKWLYKNAGKYGWSLSYPKGMEKVTGYKWECWHYRYIGIPACKLQKKWFDDVQQYMLIFINEWKTAKLSS